MIVSMAYSEAIQGSTYLESDDIKDALHGISNLIHCLV